MQRIKWSKEVLKEICSEFSTQKEFFLKYRGGYRYALENNLIEEMFPICLENSEQFWTENKIQEAAKKYTTRASLFKYAPGLHSLLISTGKMDILYPTTKRKPRKYWSEEKIREHAALCESKIDFSKKFYRAYIRALELKIIDDLNFKQIRHPKNYWTNAKVLEEANKYESLTEFYTNSLVAHRLFTDRGLKKAKHFPKKGSRVFRCIYSFVFENNYVYVGLTCNFEKRVRDHLYDLKQYSSVRNFILENPGVAYKVIKLTDYLPAEEASIKEGIFLEEYLNLGYNKINKSKTGVLGGNNRKWTFEKVKNTFLNYDSCTDLVKSVDRGAYYAACDNKWLKDLKYKNKN
jgi:hypothetical protein